MTEEEVVSNVMISNDIVKDEEKDQPTTYTLHVHNLSYHPTKQMINRDFVNSWINWAKLGWLIPSLKEEISPNFHESFLHRIHFSANGGELTGLLGSRHERREIVRLLCGRQRKGMFDGDVALSGPGLRSNYYYDYVAYVQTVSATFNTS